MLNALGKDKIEKEVKERVCVCVGAGGTEFQAEDTAHEKALRLEQAGLTGTRNSKETSMPGAEEGMRAIGDEIRELMSSQIEEGFVGHGRELDFYFENGRKPGRDFGHGVT